MPDSFLLRDWQSFFMLAGTAAATLIGLIFLAISLGARLVPANDTPALRAFVTPTVLHFGAALILAGLALIPSYTRLGLGLTLGAAGLVGAGYTAGVMGQLWRHHQEAGGLDLHHWLWHALIPAVSYLAIVSGGAGMLLNRPALLTALAAGELGLILVGLRNAFDLLLWIVRQPG